MEKPIINAKLKFNCTANWDKMGDADGGRNCLLCQKKVYDFTNSDQNEFELILAENNYNICGRFKLEQLKTPILKIPVWKKWLSAAMVFIGFNLLSGRLIAQQTRAIIKQEEIRPLDYSFPLGKIAITFDTYPKFPGGIEALNKFLQKNVSYKGREGKIIVGFDLDKKGKISNPRILSGLDSASNAEALRVMKLSPRWQPALFKGQATTITFTLPVVFQLSK
ncbi:energy transducer TonB [Mucilaginibacter sp. HD30]